jgi:hypothetical protein
MAQVTLSTLAQVPQLDLNLVTRFPELFENQVALNNLAYEEDADADEENIGVSLDDEMQILQDEEEAQSDFWPYPICNGAHAALADDWTTVFDFSGAPGPFVYPVDRLDFLGESH